MMFWIILWYFEMYIYDFEFMKCGIFKLWNILKIEYCILWIKPIFEIYKIWNGLLVNWMWVENDGLN